MLELRNVSKRCAGSLAVDNVRFRARAGEVTLVLLSLVMTAAAFEREAYALGFRHAAVGALVRSSYHADRQAEEVLAAD